MIPRAIDYNCFRCMTCGKLMRSSTLTPVQCPRCGSQVKARRRRSLRLTWSLITVSTLFLIPAYSLPVMTVVSFGKEYTETIPNGIIHLFHDELYVLAVLVFVASIVVPLFKLLGIALVCAAVQFNQHLSPDQSKWMFDIIHRIGRWSMLDLFMVSIMMGLVNMGLVASVVTGPAATYFSAIVVLTMIAANTFDSRLIWD